MFLDHGGGIISMYFHLDKILVKAGDMLKKADHRPCRCYRPRHGPSPALGRKNKRGEGKPPDTRGYKQGTEEYGPEKFRNINEKTGRDRHELEKGDLPLEESLKVFEEGMSLIKFCSERLEEVEKKVTMLVKEGDAGYIHRPFDIESNEED